MSEKENIPKNSDERTSGDERELASSDIFEHGKNISASDARKLLKKEKKKLFENIEVMVADDMTVMRRLLATYLEGEGAHVVEAKDGWDVILKLSGALRKGKKIDILLLDVNMPELSGLEALKKIRHDNKLKDTSIIMLTADSKKNDVYECVRQGISGYLLKPTQKSQLFDEIRKALRRMTDKFD